MPKGIPRRPIGSASSRVPIGDPGPAALPRVFIVSDVRLFREGVWSSLSVQTSIELVGTNSVVESVSAIVRLRPDVVLLDLAVRDSLSFPRRMRTLLPSLRVVAFAVAEDGADVLACAEAGICGYVAQDGSADDLTAAVLRAVSGELVCPPWVAALLFQRLAKLSTSAPPDTPESLTPREREIAELMALGLPNKAIAREFRLAPATIKNHVHNILQKLNLQRRGEIAGLRLPGRSAASRVERPSL
jgi:two-component system, NarL family, nitrate/nitrite response regulator NarL